MQYGSMRSSSTRQVPKKLSGGPADTMVSNIIKHTITKPSLHQALFNHQYVRCASTNFPEHFTEWNIMHACRSCISEILLCYVLLMFTSWDCRRLNLNFCWSSSRSKLCCTGQKELQPLAQQFNSGSLNPHEWMVTSGSFQILLISITAPRQADANPCFSQGILACLWGVRLGSCEQIRCPIGCIQSSVYGFPLACSDTYFC